MPSLDLSICSIVKNEASNIEALANCLPLKSIQWVVVDTGSTDGTCNLLNKQNILPQNFVWGNDFSAARNYSLSLAKHNWILWLDADDRVDEKFWDKISELIKGPRQAYRMQICSPRESSKGEIFLQIRLFPNDMRIRFEGRIHEQLGSSLGKTNILIVDSDLQIQHFGYDTEVKRESKRQRNFSILQEEVNEFPDDPTVNMEFGNALVQFGKYGEAIKVYRRMLGDLDPEKLGTAPKNEILLFYPLLLGETFEKMGQLIEAEKWYSLALNWHIPHLKPYFYMGKKFMHSGDKNKAWEYFSEALKLGTPISKVATDQDALRRNCLAYSVLLAILDDTESRLFLANEYLEELIAGGLNPFPLDYELPIEFYQKQNNKLGLEKYLKLFLLEFPNDIPKQKLLHESRNEKTPTPEFKKNLPLEKENLAELFKNFGTIKKPLESKYRHGKLSVVMIVKNEANNIAAAIESFRPIADEFVVNDTGSTDGTQTILETLGVTWFQTAWQKDFSLARNQSIDKATCAWIMWVDADDRLPFDQIENFKKLKTAPLDRIFGVEIINTKAGQPLGSRFMQVRLFPNHARLRFCYRIHEQIMQSAAKLGLHTFSVPATLYHTGYEDESLKKIKAQRNLELLAEETERLQTEPSLAMSKGDSLYILEEWEKGIEAYKVALEIPDCEAINRDIFFELPCCIGRGYQYLGKYSEAIMWLRKSAILQPQKLEPVFYEAECLLKMGQEKEAKTLLQKILSMPPPNSTTSNQYDIFKIYAYHLLANFLFNEKQYSKAAQLLEEMHKHYAQVMESWHLLGQCYLCLGENAKAEQCWRTAVDMNPALFEPLAKDFLNLLQMNGKKDLEKKYREQLSQHFPSLTIKENQQPLLSLCMIVKNEMSHLPACLKSVNGLAEEVIIYDTGSTDGTQAMAATYGARVLQGEWNGDFSEARNHSIDAAKGKWILWLDADDILLLADKQRLRLLVESHADKPFRAFGFLVKNSQDGGRTGSVFNQIRLFPNQPQLRFTAPVHEQILPAIEQSGVPVIYTDIHIIHTGYVDEATGQAKQKRNREILEKQIQAGKGVTPISYFTLGNACLDLGEYGQAINYYRQANDLARQRGNNPHVIEWAPVKEAVCLAYLKRYPEAESLLKKTLKGPGNPEAVLVKAQVEEAQLHPDEARDWYEKLLGYVEGNTFMPVDYQLYKIKALRFLGQYWNDRSKPDLALTLLKAGLRIKNGEEYNLEALQSDYRRFNAV